MFVSSVWNACVLICIIYLCSQLHSRSLSSYFIIRTLIISNFQEKLVKLINFLRQPELICNSASEIKHKVHLVDWWKLSFKNQLCLEVWESFKPTQSGIKANSQRRCVMKAMRKGRLNFPQLVFSYEHCYSLEPQMSMVVTGLTCVQYVKM